MLAHALTIDLPKRAQHTLDELLPTHFETEHQARHAVLRDLLDEVERKRGFTHRRTRRENDHFAALQAVRHLIELAVTRTYTHETLAVTRFDQTHRLIDEFLRRRDNALLALLRNAENALFSALKEILRWLTRRMRFFQNRTCGRDEFARRRLLADDLRPVHCVCRAWHTFGKLHEILKAADRFDEIAIDKQLIEQHKINRRVPLVEFDDGVVDASVTRHGEVVARTNDGDHIADNFRIPQHRADETHLGLNRNGRFGAEECCNITTLRFRLAIAACTTAAGSATRTTRAATKIATLRSVVVGEFVLHAAEPTRSKRVRTGFTRETHEVSPHLGRRASASRGARESLRSKRLHASGHFTRPSPSTHLHAQQPDHLRATAA